MPLYTVTTHQPISAADKQQIAQHITKTHCEVTGAPPDFVHVLFAEGFKLRRRVRAHVLGSIRVGRDGPTKQLLSTTLARGCAETLGVDVGAVAVVLTEVPAKWVMEGGIVLPEPGSEEDWLKRHRE